MCVFIQQRAASTNLFSVPITLRNYRNQVGSFLLFNSNCTSSNKCVFSLQYQPSCTHGPSMHTHTVINLTAAYAVQQLKTILFLAIWCFPGVLFRCKGSGVGCAVKTSCKHNSIPFTVKHIVMNAQPAGNQTATIIIVSGMKPANNNSTTNV